ncbi:MAG: nucleoside-diphosphate kinase [Candidatus Altiarchaeales archaeon]|nr:nucleoside-diphosphate kinase [Candidatus Altiarchaeales archaeon]MBD3415722.1 nucleoside-diphosphate kinase [Candidatus Altiarchaeales archaeon]
MKTLIIIRPDAVIRGLVGEIITRFEKHGIRIAGLKIMHLARKQAEELYKQHKGQPFYDRLIQNMTANPSVFVVLDTDVLDRESAIALVRKIIGDTDPAKAEMGTIRGDFGLRIDQNIIHASDSRESAEREIPLFFKKEELQTYKE